MLNFVLNTTGSSKLIYVGHSMGTTALFTMSNLHPEMADHIHSAHLLAPGNELGTFNTSEQQLLFVLYKTV